MNQQPFLGLLWIKYEIMALKRYVKTYFVNKPK
jgi:hypothetical protein